MVGLGMVGEAFFEFGEDRTFPGLYEGFQVWFGCLWCTV